MYTCMLENSEVKAHPFDDYIFLVIILSFQRYCRAWHKRSLHVSSSLHRSLQVSDSLHWSLQDSSGHCMSLAVSTAHAGLYRSLHISDSLHCSSSVSSGHCVSLAVSTGHCRSLEVTACLWQSPLVTAGL